MRDAGARAFRSCFCHCPFFLFENGQLLIALLGLLRFSLDLEYKHIKFPIWFYFPNSISWLFPPMLLFHRCQVMYESEFGVYVCVCMQMLIFTVFTDTQRSNSLGILLFLYWLNKFIAAYISSAKTTPYIWSEFYTVYQDLMVIKLNWELLTASLNSRPPN